MHEVLVNRLGGLSLPRKSVVRLTDRPDMTLDVYRGRKTTIQSINVPNGKLIIFRCLKIWVHYSLIILCLNTGTSKTINFPFGSNGKLMVLRCPNNGFKVSHDLSTLG